MSYCFQEVLLHNCSKLVEKVPLFEDAPTEFIVDICMYLQRQIYLIGEHIVQAGKLFVPYFGKN